MFVSYDWALEGTFGYDALYDEMLRQKRAESLSWFAPSVAERQMLFIAEQPDQVRYKIFEEIKSSGITLGS